jgi:hypothetical protein
VPVVLHIELVQPSPQICRNVAEKGLASVQDQGTCCVAKQLTSSALPAQGELQVPGLV